MKNTLLIIVLTAVILSSLHPSQNVNAQHGGGGMGADIHVDDHDVEITQLDAHRIHVYEQILCHNPDNESYTGKVTGWMQSGEDIMQEVVRFGPFINDTFIGGNYSRLSPVIVQYNLEDNGLEIGPNESLLIILEYNLTYSSSVFRFDKAFYYRNKFLVVSVYPYGDIDIGATNIHLDYNQDGKYYVGHDDTERILGDIISIHFGKVAEPEDEGSSDGPILPFILLIVIIGVIIIAHQVKSRNEDMEKAPARTEKRSGSNKSGSKKADSTPSGKTGNDGSTGRSIQSKQKADSATGSKSDPDELVEKKTNLLNAIKRLDEDHESGLLSDDIYSELKEEYKRKAVEVMKMIDGVK